jgi:hypothetical protein
MSNSDNHYQDRLRSIGQMDMMTRLQFIREMVEHGDHERAAEQYVWMWNHMTEHEPSMSGVRSSFMIGDIERLAESYPQVLELFRRMRDKITSDIGHGIASRRSVMDWFTLSTRLLDDSCVQEWVDGLRDSPNRIESLQQMGVFMFGWLVEKHDFALAGEMLQSAQREAMRIRHMLEHLMQSQNPPDQRAIESLTSHEIERAAQIHAAYLASDREAEAWAFLGELDGVLPEHFKAAACETAIIAKQLRDGHRDIARSLSGPEYDALRTRIRSYGHPEP